MCMKPNLFDMYRLTPTVRITRKQGLELAPTPLGRALRRGNLVARTIQRLERASTCLVPSGIIGRFPKTLGEDPLRLVHQTEGIPRQ